MTGRTGLGLLLTLGMMSTANLAAADEPAGESSEPVAKESAKKAKTSSDEEVNVAAAEPASDEPLSASVAIGGDRVEETPKALPARVPWRGTAFIWQNTATSSALGIGDDYQGSDFQQYTMSFGGMINYYLIDQEDYSLDVRVLPSAAVELTNSDITTTEHEPYFNDLPLLFGYSHTLFKSDDKMWSTRGGVRLGSIFPTSPMSSNNGTYFTTTTRLSLLQQLPLLGKDAPLLQQFTVGVSGRWDHRFGEASTAVNGDLDRPRQLSTGGTFLSDQLSGGALSENKLVEALFISFSEDIVGTTLDLDFEFSAIHNFKYDLEGSDCEVVIASGECVKATSEEDVRTSTNQIGFGVTATYYPMSEFGLRLAYANSTTQIGSDGTRRSLFWSPDAGFEASLIVSLDAIYERIVGPPRESPFVLVKNKKAPPQPTQTAIVF